MIEMPKGLRLYIALSGRRIVGKSLLLNALTEHQVSIVSDTPGTITDPCEKALEMAPLGPVVFLDTAYRWSGRRGRTGCTVDGTQPAGHVAGRRGPSGDGQ